MAFSGQCTISISIVVSHIFNSLLPYSPGSFAFISLSFLKSYAANVISAVPTQFSKKHSQQTKTIVDWGETTGWMAYIYTFFR